MNIIGKWKVNKCMHRDGDGNIIYLAQDEYKDVLLKEGADERSIFRSLAVFGKVVEFCEDGELQTLSPIPDNVPQAEIDAAVASGKVVVKGRMVVEGRPSKWKEENGEFLHEAGIDGETHETCWSKIKVIDDNTISCMMLELVRM